MLYYLYGPYRRTANLYQPINEVMINGITKGWHQSKGRRTSIAASALPTICAITLTIALFIS